MERKQQQKRKEQGGENKNYIQRFVTALKKLSTRDAESEGRKCTESERERGTQRETNRENNLIITGESVGAEGFHSLQKNAARDKRNKGPRPTSVTHITSTETIVLHVLPTDSSLQRFHSYTYIRNQQSTDRLPAVAHTAKDYWKISENKSIDFHSIFSCGKLFFRSCWFLL